MRVTLSPAQAAVLTGDLAWNGDGSAAVTTGRENTLASLRRMGMLNGNLLTLYGNDARVTLGMRSDRSVLAPTNGESDTLYVASAEPTYTPNEPVSVYATVKGDTEEFEAAHIPNGNPADVDRWITWAQDNPNWTGVRAANYTPDFPASAEMAARHTDPEQSDNVYERPSAIAAQKRLSDAMPMFNAMIGTVRVDLRGLNYRVDKVKIKTASRHNRATVSVSGRVIVDTPQHDGPNAPTYYGAYAAELFYDVPAEPTVDYATDPYAAMDAEREQLAQDNEVGAQYDGEQDATPTLTLDMSAGRTVLVRLGDHTMTIKNGSDVRLRAAFWARGLGYRPERGRALKWHRNGKTATAPLALV